MRAAVFQKYGAASELTIRSVEQPQPKATEVLIKVHASSINPIDWKIRNGYFLLRWLFGLIRPRKNILGIDFAGEIIRVGTAANKFKLHDQVFGAISGGTYAEYVCAEEGKIFYKPRSMSFQDAAGVPKAKRIQNDSRENTALVDTIQNCTKRADWRFGGHLPWQGPSV